MEEVSLETGVPIYIGPTEEEEEEDIDYSPVRMGSSPSMFEKPTESAIPMYAAAPMYSNEKERRYSQEHERFSIPFMNQPSSSSSESVVVNDWTKKNIKTICKWKDDIAKNSFIYGQLLDRKEYYLFTFSILTLVLATFMTIISGISVAVGALEIDTRWIVFSFNIIILISSGIITSLNGIVKLFSWEDEIKVLTKIIEKLDNQWFVFETELSISPEQRQNAKEFIKRADGDYMKLMQNCPHISVDDYVKCNKSYQERLSENLVWQRRFEKNLEEQLKE